MVYRQTDCLELCLQRIIIQKCNCYYPKYANLYQSLPCLNLTQSNCVDEQLLGFDINKINECTNECPLECDSILFDYSVSSLTYPSEQGYNIYEKDNTSFGTSQKISTYDLYKESYLYLNIFYPSTQCTQISISPKTSLNDLFANVGGSIGIFLGFSIFSIIEIFEIIFGVIFLFLFKK